MTSQIRGKPAVVLSRRSQRRLRGRLSEGPLRRAFTGHPETALRGRHLLRRLQGLNAAFLVSRTSGGESCLQAAEELERTWLDRIAEHPEGCNDGAFRIRADLLDYLDPRCLANDPLKPFQELAEDSLFFAQETAKRSLAFVTGKGSVARRAVKSFDLASALSTRPMRALVKDTIDTGPCWHHARRSSTSSPPIGTWARSWSSETRPSRRPPGTRTPYVR